MSESLQFQYCQKLVVIDENTDHILLARRKGEADYDGVYSFIGGKMETTDGGFIEGMRREKEEEIGRRALLLVAPYVTFNVYFTKKDGSAMILPHVYASYKGGEIELNDEYSDYKWVPKSKIEDFEPKVETIPEAVDWAFKIKSIIPTDSLVEI